jgi:hypothetical protein
MTQAQVYGYAYDITDLEQAKPLALASLRRNVHEYAMNRVDEAGKWLGRLPRVPRHIEVEVLEENVVYTPYRHGGSHLQASYVFHYPEELLA